MSLQVIKTAPNPTTWMTLPDHQSATPASFSTPVLHFHCPNTQIALSSDQKTFISEFFPGEEGLSTGAATSEIGNTHVEKERENVDMQGAQEGREEGEENEDGGWEEDTGPMVQDVMIENVDVYVTNSKFILWSPFLSAGYELTYPQITLHAITKSSTTGDSGIYMQVNTAPNTFDDCSEDDCLELTIYPSASTGTSTTAQPALSSAQSETETETAAGPNGTSSSTTTAPTHPESESQTDLLYKSLTTCSNLNPEPRPSWSMGMDDIDNDDDDDIIHHDYENENDDNDDNGITILGGASSVGGIPALAPGGWITADNVDSIQWTINGVSGVGNPNVNTSLNGLGPGAGTVRTRDDVGSHNNASVENREGEVEDEEGVVTNGMGETKWRRTG